MKPEELLSRQIAQFCAFCLPPDVYANLHPAGGGGWHRGARLKGMGLTPGFPDWLLICRGKFYGIELKAGKTPTSQEQDDCHAAIIRAGGCVAITRSLDEFQEALRTWGIPTREHIPQRGPWNEELPF